MEEEALLVNLPLCHNDSTLTVERQYKFPRSSSSSSFVFLFIMTDVDMILRSLRKLVPLSLSHYLIVYLFFSSSLSLDLNRSICQIVSFRLCLISFSTLITSELFFFFLSTFIYSHIFFLRLVRKGLVTFPFRQLSRKNFFFSSSFDQNRRDFFSFDFKTPEKKQK